jgi:hypothetical protein
MILIYLILSIWATLDPIHLLYTCAVVLRPAKITILCWLTSLLVGPQQTLGVTIRVGRWVYNEPFVPCYGAMAYVRFL